MYKVVEKIGSIVLPIHTTKNKKSAERIARQLRLINKGRIIEVKEVKEKPLK